MKLLIVDDDLTNRKLLFAMLENVGHCDIAVNGEEAIEFFNLSLKEKSPYNIIFLDIKMPVMNGHETLKEIRKIEEGNSTFLGDGVKVVMVTALGDKDNILSAFHEGCEYYLVKPFQQQKLFELIVEMGFAVPNE